MTSAKDDTLERRLGWILRGGVVASTALLAIGLVLSFLPAGMSFAPMLLQAGLVLLVATPIARVAASAVSYLIAGDWLFVVLTTIVLVELGAAVAAAIHAQ